MNFNVERDLTPWVGLLERDLGGAHLKVQDPREDTGTRGVALGVKALWEC